MPDAALDGPVRVSARELLGIGAGLRMGRAVGIAFHGDGGHADHRTLGKPLLQVVIFPLAIGQGLPPAIVVNYDGDVIRVIEGSGSTIERGVIELPFRRSVMPDEF